MSATSTRTRALLYYAGQQILWGLMTAVAAAASPPVWDGRGHKAAAVGAAIAAGLFGVLLLLAWFAGRPRRSRGRR